MHVFSHVFRRWILPVVLGLLTADLCSAAPGPSIWHIEWDAKKIIAPAKKQAKNVRLTAEDNAVVLEISPDSKAAGFELFPEFEVELRRGEQVTLVVDIKGENIVPLDFDHKEPVVVVAAFPDEKGNLHAAQTPEGTFDWQSVQITGTIPSRGKLRIDFGIRRGSGKLWVRDPRLLYQIRYPFGRFGFGGQIAI